LVINVSDGFAVANAQLEVSLPEVGADYSGALETGLNLAGLESIWNDADTVNFGDNAETPRQWLKYLFNRDEAGSMFGRMRQKFNNSCALLAVVALDADGLLAVGDHEITEDEDFEEAIEKNCPDFIYGLHAGLTEDEEEDEEVLVTNLTVSIPEKGTIYDRKVVIDNDGVDSGDETIYITFRENVVRVSSWEDNSEIAGKGDLSASFFEYNKTTGVTAFQYYNKKFLDSVDPGFELYRVVLNEAVEGKPAYVAAMTKLGVPTEDVTVTGAYNADGGKEVAVSLSADDVSDAGACVALAELTIEDDNTLACDLAGFKSSAFATFANTFHDAWEKVADLPLDDETEIPFTDLTELGTEIQ